MQLADVLGSVVSSVKEGRLRGSKLLLVHARRPDGTRVGEPYVAVDTVGAGQGELVLVVTGSPATKVPAVEGLPVDAVVVGIVDAVETSPRAGSAGKRGRR